MLLTTVATIHTLFGLVRYGFGEEENKESQGVDTHQEDVEDEEKKKFMIPHPNGIIRPRAVMI